MGYILVEIIAVVYEPYDLPLVLSGGVFQNRVLWELVWDRFPDAFISNSVPPNDGGLLWGRWFQWLKGKISINLNIMVQ